MAKNRINFFYKINTQKYKVYFWATNVFYKIYFSLLTILAYFYCMIFVR